MVCVPQLLRHNSQCSRVWAVHGGLRMGQVRLSGWSGATPLEPW